MIKKIFLFLFLVGTFLVFNVEAQPRSGRGANFRGADRSRGGQMERSQWMMRERWEKKQPLKLKTWWEKRADTNGDGMVDNKELEAWKKLTKERIDLDGDGVISSKEKRLCWRHARSRVNTPLEKKYDKDNNGWLEPEEASALFKDRYMYVKANGRAKVDSPLEEAYDANDDGIIDSEEAEVIKEDTE